MFVERRLQVVGVTGGCRDGWMHRCQIGVCEFGREPQLFVIFLYQKPPAVKYEGLDLCKLCRKVLWWRNGQSGYGMNPSATHFFSFCFVFEGGVQGQNTSYLIQYNHFTHAGSMTQGMTLLVGQLVSQLVGPPLRTKISQQWLDGTDIRGHQWTTNWYFWYLAKYE